MIETKFVELNWAADYVSHLKKKLQLDLSSQENRIEGRRDQLR
jgi:hypothetical protein